MLLNKRRQRSKRGDGCASTRTPPVGIDDLILGLFLAVVGALSVVQQGVHVLGGQFLQQILSQCALETELEETAFLEQMQSLCALGAELENTVPR